SRARAGCAAVGGGGRRGLRAAPDLWRGGSRSPCLRTRRCDRDPADHHRPDRRPERRGRLRGCRRRTGDDAAGLRALPWIDCMDSRVGPELIALGILLLFSAILSGAEAAYFSLGRTRLKELAEQQGEKPGPLTPLLKQPHELLVTLLVGITVVNIAASALAASVAGKLFGSAGLAVAIGRMTFLLSVFGEVLPMTLAVEHPRTFSAWVSRPVAWLSAVIAPVRWVL